YTIPEGSSLSLNAADPAQPTSNPQAYSWDLNGDGVYGDATGIQPTLTWSQLESLGLGDGSRTVSNVTVQVDDGQGYHAVSALGTLTIVNTAPTASFANNGPIPEGSSALVSFATAFDPPTADIQAGLHYSYALVKSDL